MEIGMIGLGRMGGNMAQRLINGGHKIIVYDPIKDAVMSLVQQGAIGTFTLAEFVVKLTAPRAVWLMVPSGNPTETTINELAELLSADDIVIDGGNSNYKDSMRHGVALAQKGILFLDAGTSGGIWGIKEGYSLMVGGNVEAYRRVEPVFQTLAPSPDKGYGYVGPSGSGHFVKMVHNGIEYGLMEAYAEGFELLHAKQEFTLNLNKVAEIWKYGSVIRSWLLELAELALREDPDLKSIQAYVEDSGEGRWVAQESLELGIPLPLIVQALQVRFRSRQEQPFGNKMLAALRNQFGGHRVRKA